MNKKKELNIKGAILDKHQLENYLEKIASDHTLTEKSDKSTYPLPALKDNFAIIKEVYKLLNEQIKEQIPIHPAGEWILDNFYIIEEIVKSINKELSLKKYLNFVALANGRYKGFARVYVLATEMVAYTDGKINAENLTMMLQAYQNKKTLSMNEIWNIGLFIQIALIENIKEICETIYMSQYQKQRARQVLSKFFEEDKKVINSIQTNKINLIKNNQMKNSFIEYMSYKLKKYGSKAYPYLNILEEEVSKTGNDIEEVVKKEHFNIAVKKVSVGNSIISLKAISRINFLEIFEKINRVEDILKQDPVKQYEKMDVDTKVYYRNKIQEISKKTKISEIYITKKALELSKIAYENNQQNKTEKKAHIGYYLISDGKEELLNSILDKKVKIKDGKTKAKLYVQSVWLLTIMVSLIISLIFYFELSNNIILSTILFILLIIPTQNIISKIEQYILSKIIKPKLIPKLDFENGIPKQYSTMVVIPTILKNKEKVRELMEKLEVFYIANKMDNIYFTLLGDCTASNKKEEKEDKEIIKQGIKETNRLNKKYNFSNRFSFIYRKREWSNGEDCYMGWERKRGLLNQFNEYILGNITNPFRINTIENLPKEEKENLQIKYIITLDSDTDLTLNSGIKMIGAMAHILNNPVLNNKEDLVVSGHALMQPRVGLGLLESRNSLFTQIYAGEGGTDSYTNAISNLYHDNFDEGIFTGKGIYDLKIFSKVLNNEIKENTVLSHDLLEGSYLRCGLSSDIMLMDGFPSNYISFRTRLYRWVRGDYQILPWLKKNIENREGVLKKNPLNFLSKYKIFSNIIRSKVEFAVFILIMYSLILMQNLSNILYLLIIFSVVSIIIPTILDILNLIITKKSGNTKTKKFVKTIDGIKASILRGLIDFLLIPDKMYINIKAEIKTMYRMLKSKKHLLEWTTSEEAEKEAKSDITTYYKNMCANTIIGILGIVSIIIMPYKIVVSINIILLSILWLIAPGIMCIISKKNKPKESIEELNKEEIEYIKQLGYKTWLYFKENLTEEVNFLPPDNYQEDRKPKLVKRTSSTNIGLALLSVVASYDLKYESLESTINLLYKMIDTICKLSKWNGHLYNWYNIETLEPLVPRYISSVDSGNFIGYLFVLKQFLENIKQKSQENQENQENQESQKVQKTQKSQENKLNKEKEQNKEKEENNIDEENIIINNIKRLEQIDFMIENINKIIIDTDFSKLYDTDNRLFSVGFNIEDNILTDSYYDLLASEARQTSLIAIAKKDVSEKHWYNLSRTLTTLDKYKGLISWSGTSFEYLMPTVNIYQYPGSILDESCKFMIMSQIKYAKKLGVPWGISEAAFNLRDLNNNYQYKAFGIPWLGLKRGLSDEIVTSTYGSVLAIEEQPKKVVENLKLLESKNMYNKYGFYESIDFTPGRTKKESMSVKTYMAHHQGLILLSIDNLLNKQIIKKRFMKNPEIQAVKILLQEKMPENMIITKEEKEKVEKIKYKDYEDYIQRKYTKINEQLNISNVISNDKYTIVMDQYGEGYSKYKEIQINRYKVTEDITQGIKFYIKNIRNKKIWTNIYSKNMEKPDKYNIIFAPEVNKIVRSDENIETITKTCIDIDEPIEIRRLELRNTGTIDEMLEVTAFLEPIISNKMQDYAHKAFNNLFLSYEYIEVINTILIKRKPHSKGEKEIFMAINLYTPENAVGEAEYEIDKERFFGRNNYKIPKAVENSIPLTKRIGYTTDPIVAIKNTIIIKPEKNVSLDLIISVGEDKETVLRNIVKYMNNETIKRNFELAKAKSEAENRYLGIKGREIEIYQKMLSYLLFNKKEIDERKYNTNYKYSVSSLWKYGISGDLPILLVKIKNINDIDIINEVLSAYEFFRVKNIKVDLVILNEEKGNYENYIRDGLQIAILNRNIGYLLNTSGGIFCLENVEKEDKKVLEIRSNLIIDAQYSSLELQMEEIENKILQKSKEVVYEVKRPHIVENDEIDENILNEENLKYYNEYGGFSKDGKEYIIKVNSQRTLPTVWSHIITNKQFGSLLTENMGGYTWYKNSRLNRITAWSNDQVIDIPSEIIYIKDEDTQKKWSLGYNPMHDGNNYYIIYGFGYAKYIHNSSKIKQTLETFVPINDNVKVNLITLENKNPHKKNIKLMYYIKPVLDEDETKSNGYINLNFKEKANTIFINNLSNDNINQVFISSSQEIKSYTGDKLTFFKESGIDNPSGLDQIELNRQNSIGRENCLIVQLNVTLEAYSTKEISLIIGTGKDEEESLDLAYKYSNIGNCKNENVNVRRYWSNLINRIQITTPMESTNILLNGWLIYQTLCARLYGKTGFYQSGGAYGFRDQLQDVMSIKYICPEITKEQILRSSEHQFLEGDVEHWWHEENKRGIRTRISDDLLWLAYVTADYIEYTGDYLILEEQTNYKEGKILDENEEERYDLYKTSNVKENLYNHCIRAIEKSLNFGEHGLPKIGTGDWNDGLSNVGPKGIGESIWLGFFLYAVLEKFIPICNYKNDLERVKKYEEEMQKLKKSLNTYGWDSRWYKRAFTDDGQILGSLKNEECKIDSISQSWATISGAGDNDKKYIAMDSLENHLIDRELGIIKLLDPPFEKSKLEPGYIKAYLPGTRENGGQYTHAAIWTIIAQTILNLNDKAYENFRMINPIEHTRTKEESLKYKVEPYVIAADVYGHGNLGGRGGWTWYTGSSSWMYIAGIRYILGLEIKEGYLTINPHVPSDWKEYEIKYEHGKSRYNIKVVKIDSNINIDKNNIQVENKIKNFICNGEKIEEKRIKLNNTGGVYNIEIHI